MDVSHSGGLLVLCDWGNWFLQLPLRIGKLCLWVDVPQSGGMLVLRATRETGFFSCHYVQVICTGYLRLCKT